MIYVWVALISLAVNAFVFLTLGVSLYKLGPRIAQALVAQVLPKSRTRTTLMRVSPPDPDVTIGQPSNVA